MTFSVRVSGVQETQDNLERLRRQSPARARRAVNRSVGVAKQRVIKSIASATGLSRRVVGGRQTRRTRGGDRVKGTGYVKQVKASRVRSEGALVVLTSGVRISRANRKTLGGLRVRPGGLGKPFRATMPSGFSSLFERRPPQRKSSQPAKNVPGRKNLPIRELVIPIEPYASRAAQVVMRRIARTVYPEKVWEELQKSIKPVQ